MYGTRFSPTIMLSVALVLAVSARMGRDAILDMINPVANAAAARMEPPEIVPAVTPIATPTTDLADLPISHHIERSANGLFYIQASINDRPIRFLLDTGASVVVLTAADARLAGISVHEAQYDRSVDTVGGSTPMAWTTLGKVNVAGHEVRGLKAAVVRSGLGVSLLGQNMLAKLDSVTITADRVSLR